MRSLLHPLNTILILAVFVAALQAATLVITSSSPLAAATANYTIALSLTAQTSIRQVDFAFEPWTDSSIAPFRSNTQLVYSGSTIQPSYFPQRLICSLTPVAASSFSFTLTNMYNPASTRPYQVTVTLTTTTGSTSSYTGSLTVTQVANTTFPIAGYSLNVGATSTAASLFLAPQNAQKFNNYFLRITYDSSLITLSLGTSTLYSIVSSSVGTIVLGSFTSTSNLLIIDKVTIVNPRAAITSTINCLFYIVSSSISYNVEAFFASNTLTAEVYTTLTTSSTFQYGLLGSLSIISSCPYSQVSNGSTSAYTVLTYNSSQLSTGSSSNCQSTSSTTCRHNLGNNYTLTSILPSIDNYSSSTITVTSYTFFNGAFYPLCQSTLSVPVVAQTITTTANTTQCTSSIVNQPNTIELYIIVSNVAAGDVVYMSGIKGTVGGTGWTTININGISWYYYTLAASTIATINTTASRVTLPLSYSNPTYTTTNSITNLHLRRKDFQYAASTNIAICPVTTPLTITTHSLSPTSTLTYQPTNISIDATMQLYNYQAGDYIILSFNSNDTASSYLLAGSYIGASYSGFINGIAVSIIGVNSTGVRLVLTNQTLPSATKPVLRVLVSNLCNPPFASSVWVRLDTYDSSSGGRKETLTTSSLSITTSSLSFTASNLNILSNNSLSLVVSNRYRNLLNLNASSFTTVNLSVPSQLSCSSATNNSVTVNWFAGVTTSGPSYSGNTTHLTLNLGTCYINFFSGAITYTISETYNGLASTATSIPVTNICGNQCYQCSANACTSCFNTTYSTYLFLYNGQCYQNCPVGSYETSSSSCSTCHTSCSSCTGPTYSECSTCANNYQNSSGYCLSVCGDGKFLSGGSCATCHPNCKACLSSSSCYVCKINAILLASICEFTSCTSPCLKCLGSQSSCTSCSVGYSLYNWQCLLTCPYGTYKATEDGQSVCKSISESNAYIPISIAGIVGMLVLLALRVYSNKKIGNQSRRSKMYSSAEDVNSINYKINLWRVGSVLYTYLEIIAAVVLVAKNLSYGLSPNSTTVVVLGIIFHLLANVTFLVGYCCIVQKNRVTNSQQQNSNAQKKTPIRQKIILALSVLISFRSYKLLYSNLFVDRSQQGRIIERTAYPNEQTFNPMSKITLKSSGPPQVLPAQSLLKNKTPANTLNSKKTLVAYNPKGHNSPTLPPDSTPSKKAIRSNSLADEALNEAVLPKTQSFIEKNDDTVFEKRFNYPFLSYLTFASLISATLLILVGSCLQMVIATFSNMLFWGIDALIVVVVSLLLTGWDLWNFTNLSREEQNTEMSSKNEQEVNYTHENLKQAAEAEVQVEIEKTQKKSPKRIASLRPKLSNRSICKKEEEVENPPILKDFDDIEENDQTVAKQTKTKKFTTKNLRYGRKLGQKHNASVTNTKKGFHGELCDDLYINFPSYKVQKDASTTYHYRSNRSHKSVSPPDRSLNEQELQLDGDFEEQPPNFPDISDIQEMKVEKGEVSNSEGGEQKDATEVLQERPI